LQYILTFATTSDATTFDALSLMWLLQISFRATSKKQDNF